MLAGDIAFIGLDQPLAIWLLHESQNRCLAMDLRPQITCADGHGLGNVCGLNIAVARMLDGADQAIGLAQRPDFLDFVRTQACDFDADGLGNRGGLELFVHPVLVHGQANVADLAETYRLPGFRF
jgi:hypothetical protein